MNPPSKNYKFIDAVDYSNTDDVATIEITEEGEFNGVEFTFGTINVNEKEDSATISFDYRIHNNDEIEKSPEVKERFEVLIEGVLNDILYTALIEAEKRHFDEHRKKDSEAPSE